MSINLYYSLYFEKQEKRRKELEKCFEFNLNAGFDSITILCEEVDLSYLQELTQNRTNLQVISSRATFQNFFDLSEDGAINVCCNADIFFVPKELDKVRNFDWNKYPNMAMCLNRYDVHTFNLDGTVGIAHHLNRKDSADVWIWKNKCRVINGNICIGFPGCDNSLAFKFMESGYNTINPSNDLKTYHLHLTGLNNYRTADGHVKGEMVCPPPYWFHEPCYLNDIT